ADNLYIADAGNNRIRRVTAAGIISTVAGNGTNGFSGDRGPATEAQLNDPRGVAVDSGGNLYIADVGNHRVRRVASTGIIKTVVGNGTSGSSGDGGPAAKAQLSGPGGIAVDAGGNLYIADLRAVRKVSTGGIITRVAGVGGLSGYSGDGGLATLAQIFAI